MPAWYRPGMTPGLGDIDVERVKADIKAAVIKSVIAQVAVNTALNFVPVIGNAAAALLSVVQTITGKRYEKKIKDRVAQVAANVQAAADRAAAQVGAKADRLYRDTLPIAQAVALQGLGDVWSKIKSEAVRAVPKATKIVRMVAKAPITLHAVAVKEVAHVAAQGLTSVGLTSAAEAVDKAGSDTKRFAENAPSDFYNLAIGREPWLVADQRCNEIEQQAYAQINEEAGKVLSYLDTPEARNEMILKTAAGLRQDPNFIASAGLLLNQGASAEAQALALQNQLPKTTSPLPLVAGAGLAAVMVFFAR